jgi:hypothetical protein
MLTAEVLISHSAIGISTSALKNSETEHPKSEIFHIPFVIAW